MMGDKYIPRCVWGYIGFGIDPRPQVTCKHDNSYVVDHYFQATLCDHSCLTERSRKVKFEHLSIWAPTSSWYFSFFQNNLLRYSLETHLLVLSDSLADWEVHERSNWLNFGARANLRTAIAWVLSRNPICCKGGGCGCGNFWNLNNILTHSRQAFWLLLLPVAAAGISLFLSGAYLFNYRV